MDNPLEEDTFLDMKHSSNLYHKSKKGMSKRTVVGLKLVKTRGKSPLKQYTPGKYALLAVQKRRCAYCGAFMSTKRGPNHRMAVSVDHVYPRSKFSNLRTNHVLCCRECNQRKQDNNPTPRQLKWYRNYTVAGIAYTLASIHEKAFTEAHEAWHAQKQLNRLSREEMDCD